MRGTLNVLLAAESEGAVVVSASSSSVYGDQDIFPPHEDMRPDPRSPSAVSKLAVEASCRAMWLSSGVHSVSLPLLQSVRARSGSGERVRRRRSAFHHRVPRGHSPVIQGDGEQARDFTFTDDVVDANLIAMRALEATFGRAFNIGAGRTPVSVNRLLERALRGDAGSDP